MKTISFGFCGAILRGRRRRWLVPFLLSQVSRLLPQYRANSFAKAPPKCPSKINETVVRFFLTRRFRGGFGQNWKTGRTGVLVYSCRYMCSSPWEDKIVIPRHQQRKLTYCDTRTCVNFFRRLFRGFRNKSKFSLRLTRFCSEYARAKAICPYIV